MRCRPALPPDGKFAYRQDWARLLLLTAADLHCRRRQVLGEAPPAPRLYMYLYSKTWKPILKSTVTWMQEADDEGGAAGAAAVPV